MNRELTVAASPGRRAGFRASLAFLVGGLLVAGLAPVAGCTGSIGDGETCATCAPPGVGPLEDEALLVTSRFPRLSHLQWENTVRDLLYLPQVPGLSASFTGDPLGGAFDNNETSLLVTPGLWADYQLAAEDLAEVVTSDAAMLAKLLPPDAPSDPAARAEAFIQHFGTRAYRRPLSGDEVSALAALFAKGPELADGPDDFAKGARLVLQAILQSPHFVYRVQASSEVVEGLIPLSSYEVATKLSYMLWNTMPDDKLFAAAAAGQLSSPEGVMKEAERLLDHDNARAMVASFHEQLYQYDHYEDLYKDPALFPDYNPELGADMRRETQMFIEDVIFEGNGGIEQILTEPYTFVNADLAALYGVEGDYTATFERADLDPTERTGFLTRIGFLASNATSREQHSIYRGVFVNRRIICAELPDPPANVPGLPGGDFATNRERVDSHTGEGTCGATCHGSLINPAGFAFEHYDALGQYRTMENGNPINSADEYPLGGEKVSYGDAIEFSEIIAKSDEAHGCYAKYWLAFAYGREMQKGDEASLTELAAQSRAGAKPLILALTQTKAFRTRAPNQETK